jgi:hypothetical protein
MLWCLATLGVENGIRLSLTERQVEDLPAVALGAAAGETMVRPVGRNFATP